MKLIRLAAALVALLVAGIVQATDVRVCWTPPTQNTDGSALTNLAGFRIHYGPTTPDRLIDVSNPGVTCYVVSGLPPATWKFAVTAYSSTGAHSDFSNMVTRVIDAAPPSPVPAAPGVLTVTASRQVYVIKQTADRVSAVPVGTVPADTRCVGSNGIFFDGRVLFKVPVASVTWSGSVRSVVVVADCS